MRGPSPERPFLVPLAAARPCVPPSALRPPSPCTPTVFDACAAALLLSLPPSPPSAHARWPSRGLLRSRVMSLFLSRSRTVSVSRSAWRSDVARGRPHGVSEG
jgi:hypothetical protein